MGEKLRNLLNEKKVTWYHASALDGRPVMALRALMNWNVGDEASNSLFRLIGYELRDTVVVYNDFSPSIYKKLHSAWKRTKAEGYNGIRLLHGMDLVSASIKPFTIFNESDRASYITKYERARGAKETDNMDYEGFIIKFPWFKCFPDLCDTIVFLCLDDMFVKELFDKYNAEVVAFFEHNAGNEGSPGFQQLYTKQEFVASSIRYLFTNHYNYCDNFGGYLLCNNNYSDVWDKFDVYNLIRGYREELLPMPTPLPEHEPGKNDSLNGYCDICKKREVDYCRMGTGVVGSNGGFCLAIRKDRGRH